MAIKIMLDAGHYEKRNQSPVVPKYYESEMTWKLHYKLKTELEKYGFDVGVTRTDQIKDLEITKRGKKALGYDLFISLHSNASNSEKVDYAIAFYSYENLNNAKVLAEKLSMEVASVMNVNNGSKVSTRSYEFDYGTDEYYGVLRGAKSVGCPLYYILEHSFHTNTASANWLLEETNLEKLAVAESKIIADYYGIKKPYSKGDVDGDGIITAKDYLLTKRAYLGTYEIKEK